MKYFKDREVELKGNQIGCRQNRICRGVDTDNCI